VEECYGVGTRPCTAADPARFGMMAVSHPASCGFINWRYEEGTWGREDVREVWGSCWRWPGGGGRGSVGGWRARECRRVEGAA
jgi:hypothetical protein